LSDLISVPFAVRSPQPRQGMLMVHRRKGDRPPLSPGIRRGIRSRLATLGR